MAGVLAVDSALLTALLATLTRLLRLLTRLLRLLTRLLTTTLLLTRLRSLLLPLAGVRVARILVTHRVLHGVIAPHYNARTEISFR